MMLILLILVRKHSILTYYCFNFQLITLNYWTFTKLMISKPASLADGHYLHQAQIRRIVIVATFKNYGFYQFFTIFCFCAFISTGINSLGPI